MFWVIFIGSLLFLIIISSLMKKCNTVLWNGGICPNCQTNWELRSVCKGNGFITKYYVCPHCHQEIKIKE